MTAVLETPVTPTGLAVLARVAFAGGDLAPFWNEACGRIGADATDAAAAMDLSVIAQLVGHREDGLSLQAQALASRRVYSRPQQAARPSVRLLAFMAPGDFMANTPLEFLLENSDVRLDMVYLTPDAPVPNRVPEHDLAIVAVAESEANRPILHALEPIVRAWHRPVLNRPERIAALSRDGACALLRSAPGIEIPRTVRVGRAQLARLAVGKLRLEALLPGAAFPIIARPLASHAGKGLARLDDEAALRGYLAEQPEDTFYVAPFVDYRSADGMFRKYRVALIEGEAFACHMAISQHWMVHYLNAGMIEDATKREEEARFMAGFDEGFARRHAGALRAITERSGLDYVALDCGETPDGRLLIFEVDVAMIVHMMDPPDLFPYKQPQMRKVCDAFRRMLQRRGAPPTA
jgi:glutathione synthase/RimK-type ligase-like ATP-grasp enzyme